MTQKSKIWLNGEMIPWDKANVHLLSHGFSRASAIFEVFSFHLGPDGPATFRMDKNIARLMNSAKLLSMKLSYTPDEISAGVLKAIHENEMNQGFIKVFAYWSEEAFSDLVLDSPLDLAILPISIEGENWGFENVPPISACISKWKKINPATVPVNAKACSNYLNGYLSNRNAIERGFDLGIMTGTDGFVAEGPMESLFVVKDGVLKTPPLGRVLNSITRLSLLEIAEVIGIAKQETVITIDDLYSADEMFSCHTGLKVIPIKRFENIDLVAPGKITKQLAEVMNNILCFKDERFLDWFQQ